MAALSPSSYVLAPLQTKLSSHFPSLFLVTVDVVIPTLNEEENLSRCLPAVLAGGFLPESIIVADGGSTDSTRAVAENSASVRVTSSAKGRAQQMNAGAAAGTGDLILFLHADTIIQPGTQSALKDAGLRGAAGGCFARTFYPNSPLMTLSCWLATFRAWGLGIAYGDQGLWIRRDVFEHIGGFPELDVFEDVELALQIAEHGPFEVLRPTISTSGRRFEMTKGQLRRDARLTWKYYLDRIREQRSCP